MKTMAWDKFDSALKEAREEAMVEVDKAFAEFSTKHDANIAELRRMVADHEKKMDELTDKLANNQPIKNDIEKMLANMQA